MTVFFLLPTAGVILYFLFMGQWARAFLCAMLFIACSIMFATVSGLAKEARHYLLPSVFWGGKGIPGRPAFYHLRCTEHCSFVVGHH
jgi:hypothetical protein